MSISIPENILGINSQLVNTIEQRESGEIIIICNLLLVAVAWDRIRWFYARI